MPLRGLGTQLSPFLLDDDCPADIAASGTLEKPIEVRSRPSSPKGEFRFDDPVLLTRSGEVLEGQLDWRCHGSTMSKRAASVSARQDPETAEATIGGVESGGGSTLVAEPSRRKIPRTAINVSSSVATTSVESAAARRGQRNRHYSSDSDSSGSNDFDSLNERLDESTDSESHSTMERKVKVVRVGGKWRYPCIQPSSIRYVRLGLPDEAEAKGAQRCSGHNTLAKTDGSEGEDGSGSGSDVEAIF
ncbi:hypothetical protein NMY22_g3389 [Coprinellus aureogranulatus]|nr:hypothetical protein NMY22_g3389 [Coprinellus aureogranulatus]